MRIANFNVQNLRLRQRAGQAALDGARDRDMDTPDDPTLDTRDRRLTAEVLRAVDADAVALQEVFDRDTLVHFHDRFLVPAGLAHYPHLVCLPGNDGQGMNVALMSRLPPVRIESHARATADTLGLRDVPEGLRRDRLFRRDCLEVDIGALTLFICHFKAPYPDAEAAARVRHAEADAVRRIIERRYPDPRKSHWLVVGDLNDPAAGTARSALAPLTGGFAVDLMARIPGDQGWTYAEPDRGAHGRPDGLLASPALADAFPHAIPRIFRAGMDPAFAAAEGAAFRDVGSPRPHASDHALVFVDLPGW